MKNFIITTIAVCFAQISFAQNTTVKIVDSATGETIPLADIQIGTETMISNDEGYFTLPAGEDERRIAITSMGYVGKETSFGTIRSSNYIVKLDPAAYEIEDVTVANHDPVFIMANVKKNLARHYNNTVPVAKDLLFVRTTSGFTPNKMNIDVKKSTGFSKKAIAETNDDFNKFSTMLKTHPPKSYTDMLCTMYTPAKSPTKLDVIKATRLVDERRAIDVDELQDKFTSTVLKHLDTTKYYRAKSGLFGTRDTISLRKDFKTKKQKKKQKDEITAAKGKLTGFMTESNLLPGSKLTFVTEPELYTYEYAGATFMNNDDLVYILKFKPRKNKALYTGTVYVAAEDFAVLRTDYALAKGKTEGGINMKLILGVKASENISNGTTIYRQNTSGNGYYLQYASIEEGQYIYLNRPLKFIELAAEDKDVVEFEIKIEANTRNKAEFLNISRTETADSELAKVSEANFKYVALKRYDPSIWAQYSAIEPLEEMKRFTVPE